MRPSRRPKPSRSPRGARGRGAPGAGAPAALVTSTEAGTRQRLEQATAALRQGTGRRARSRAVIAAQRHQLEVLSGTKKQRCRRCRCAKAVLAAGKAEARLHQNRGTLRWRGQRAPGAAGRLRQYRHQPDHRRAAAKSLCDGQLQGDAADAGASPDSAVEITVDSFPNEKLHGRVERIAPASGSQFALLPPDNATGNFTKVVQRIPVRIQLDENQPLLQRLLPGMSVVTSIHTDDGGTNGSK